ncbi:hypothetical protein [Rhodopseudomonas pseudopalustris]|uniref:Uncharacterized protein n=2 Tax=Rhodopseudomonas TaxID=1073 RepID=Q130J9_RHOPS|nr:hypothetical protein [Rhodopseudomonas pseudopalustris]ABE41490.1 hypothetical protein RPD_4273 [Rhodopseudomonas palustris BisB5]MBB1092385.1 hypothetical protein [Rhodopseudomonas palustris]SEO07539.1 hypothetical protein SAMN05444123_101183 [Rhodopseudomonas pseudopalustris]
MTNRRLIAIAAALAFSVAPALAQTSSTEPNAHRYQGGPKTGTPHATKNPDTGVAKKTGQDGGHHYSGGPKSENHHMGEKK